MEVIIRKCSKCEDYIELIINNKVEMSGDYYHDKIGEAIKGFICGLNYAGIETKVVKEDFECKYC